MAAKEPITCHMLRHTAASHWGKLSTPDYVAHRMLNHCLTSLGTTYLNYDFRLETGEAFRRWEDRLLEISAASGVPDSLWYT